MPADYSRLDSTDFPPATMRKIKAAVVGAGAIGNEVIKNLCLLGVGRIVIVDPDIVESSNLTRSIFFRLNDSTGVSKVEAIANAVGRLFPDTMCIPVEAEIADVGLQRLSDADLIFSCVDNELARLEIAYLAKKLGLPVIDAGLAPASERSRCRVGFFPASAEAPCFGCLLPAARRRELLTSWSAIRYSCWGFDDAPGIETVAGTPVATTPMMASVAGAIQVEYGLRAVMRGESRAFSLTLDLHPGLSIERFTLSRAVECPLHESLGPPRIPPGEGIGSFFENAGPDAALILDWPVCSSAECLACGLRWQPRQRVSRFRAAGRCPGCGSRRLVEDEVLTSITQDSPWRDSRFTDLGLPENHLYSFREEATS
jgi:adenylyltransferase/sulfurtransferase